MKFEIGIGICSLITSIVFFSLYAQYKKDKKEGMSRMFMIAGIVWIIASVLFFGAAGYESYVAHKYPQ